jgi:hypothetical protein
MRRLFLSYRREDSLDITGRICDRLAARFGRESVFMDVDTIPFGVDFREHMNKWVTTCDVVLVVIGETWLDAAHAEGAQKGARRLSDPADFVRIEVEAALARNIPVIPVLVGSATMPAREALPPGLAALTYRNAAEVRSGRDFHGHVDRLIRGIERVLEPERSEPPARPAPLAEVPPPEPTPPVSTGYDPHEALDRLRRAFRIDRLPEPGETCETVDRGTGRKVWLRHVTGASEVAMVRAFGDSMRNLSHAALQSVIHVGDEEATFLAVERAHGITLAELLGRRVAIPEPAAIRIVRKLLELVVHARSNPLPSLDPRRIMLGPITLEPEPLLCWMLPELGLAELEYGVEYRAIEQIDAPGSDPASAVFTAGQILWELLMGRSAYSGGPELVRNAKRGQRSGLKIAQPPMGVSSAVELFVAQSTFPQPQRRPTPEGAITQLLSACPKGVMDMASPINLGFEGPVAGGLPYGWFDSLGFVNAVSTGYDFRVEHRTDAQGDCVRLFRRGSHSEEFGSLMQRCPAAFLAGRTVRFAGTLRTEAVSGWAGLWLRAEGKQGPREILFFHNTHDCAKSGTTPWQRVEFEAELPPGVVWLSYGVLLAGDGTVWADQLELSIRTWEGEWAPLAWERLAGGG